MSFISGQPKDLSEPRAVVDAIRARRGGTLLNLDCMLLHSPALAEGWNGLLRAVRTELEVSLKLRELATFQSFAVIERWCMWIMRIGGIRK